MATQSRGGRPPAKRTAPAKKTVAPRTEVITEESVPEVPTDPAPGSSPVVEANIPAETAEQREIRELKEQVKALMAQPQPDSEPDSEPTKVEETPEEGDTFLIHFLEDGITAQGQVWYRGQELEFMVGSKAWNDTFDRFGKSWILMSENDQADRKGKVYFRRGPWPGKPSYKDGQWEKDAPAESALEQADIKERERRRKGAPTLPDPSKM